MWWGNRARSRSRDRRYILVPASPAHDPSDITRQATAITNSGGSTAAYLMARSLTEFVEAVLQADRSVLNAALSRRCASATRPSSMSPRDSCLLQCRGEDRRRYRHPLEEAKRQEPGTGRPVDRCVSYLSSGRGAGGGPAGYFMGIFLWRSIQNLSMVSAADNHASRRTTRSN